RRARACAAAPDAAADRVVLRPLPAGEGSHKLPPTTNSKTASALAPRDASTETEGAMPKKRLPPDAACATHHPHGSYGRRWSGPRVHPHSAGADERRGSCAAERRCDLGARNIGPRKATSRLYNLSPAPRRPRPLRAFIESLLLRRPNRFEEANLNKGTFVRRDVLELMVAAGATGLAAVRTFWPSTAHAAGASAYSPAARFDLAVSEVELRRHSAGRMLMARIYQPKGPGPFPTVLDLHGGAWNRKDRFAEEPMDRALASSGLLVVAVDLTVAPEAPYPACVQDAN